MKRVTVACCALLLLGQAGTYRVRVAFTPEVGRSVKKSNESHTKEAFTLRDSTGRVLKTSNNDRVAVQEWTDATIRRAGDSATFRDSFTKAEVELNGKRVVSPMQGESVTITVRGDNVGMMASNGRPLREEARQNVADLVRGSLRAEANNDCVPVTPLAVGSTWNVPSDQARDCFARLGVPAGPVTATGRLTSVENGYASIDFRFAAKMTSVDELEFDPPASVDGTVRLRIALANAYDWTSTRTVHLSGTAQSPAKLESMTVDQRLTGVSRSGG